MELGDLRHDDFATRIGDRFTADLHDGGTIELELVAAHRASGDRPDHAHSAEWKCGVLFEQGIYELRHDELGSLPIFLVPVAEHGDGFVYEAVFTRLGD